MSTTPSNFNVVNISSLPTLTQAQLQDTDLVLTHSPTASSDNLTSLQDLGEYFINTITPYVASEIPSGSPDQYAGTAASPGTVILGNAPRGQLVINGYYFDGPYTNTTVIYGLLITRNTNSDNLPTNADNTNWFFQSLYLTDGTHWERQNISGGGWSNWVQVVTNDLVNLNNIILTPNISGALAVGKNVTVFPSGLVDDISLTLPLNPSEGSIYTIYGTPTYSVTVSSGPTVGSPNINMPDNSIVYAWLIPSGGSGDGIRLVYDGTNWRAETFGQKVVANATANNQAVALGQLLKPYVRVQGLGNIGANRSASNSITITMPSNGYIFAFAELTLDIVGQAQVKCEISINGNVMDIENTTNAAITMYVGYFTEGEAVTVAGLTVSTTDPVSGGSSRCGILMVPST